MKFYQFSIITVLMLLGLPQGYSQAQQYQYQPTSLSNRENTTHADQNRKGFLTGLFGSRTCQPQQQYQQPAPNINISVPPNIQQGPDPATIGMLNSVLSNQGQMMYQLGRIQGQQQAVPAYPPVVPNPAPIIINPPAPPVVQQPQQPIVIQPFTPPVQQQQAPYVSPYVAPIPYQPQQLPIAYAPQPLPQGYSPQPLPQQYQPQPLPQQYQPAPLPGGYAPQQIPQHIYQPQLIVNPGNGANPTPGAAPQALPPGFSPAPMRGGPPGSGGSPPGFDFRYYQGGGGGYNYPPEVASKNGSNQPPAAQPQVYSRMPRPEREKVAR